MASDNEQNNEQNNEQDQHSIWNGRFKANPKEGKFFLEMIDKLGAQFDGMPIEEIMQTFWGEERDVLDKLIKKANKREKKEEAKFAVKGMKRAPTANILFQRDYIELCKKNGTKFELKLSSVEYNKLSVKEKAKYQKEAERLKVEYQVEFERLRANAIKNGDFPEDKPKRPLSGFLRYLADVREEITEKYKDVEDRKRISAQISKDAGEMWNGLTDNEKAPYNIAYRKEKDVFDEKLKQWESNETERHKKQSNSTKANVKSQVESADVAIETTGTKSETVKSHTLKKAKEPVKEPAKEPAKEPVKEPVKEPSTVTETADSDVEQPVQKSKPSAKHTAKTLTKTITKVTTSETEGNGHQSDSDSEPVVAIVKPKKTIITKPKTVVELDVENEHDNDDVENDTSTMHQQCINKDSKPTSNVKTTTKPKPKAK